MAELYRDKIMFFLVHRRYNEADYCDKIYKELSIKKLTIENVAFLFTKIFSKRRVYKILRMYYWLRKIIKNNLQNQRTI